MYLCSVVILKTRVPSEDLLHNSGLVDIRRVLKRNRLRMFGHVARRGTDEPLGKVWCLEAPGRRPPGRPKKTWAKNVEENLREVGLDGEDALERERWHAIINRLTS